MSAVVLASVFFASFLLYGNGRFIANSHNAKSLQYMKKSITILYNIHLYYALRQIIVKQPNANSKTNQ